MAPVRRRKNLFIDQRRIDRAKALLHAETENRDHRSRRSNASLCSPSTISRSASVISSDD
jgi:hypothetical protein